MLIMVVGQGVTQPKSRVLVVGSGAREHALAWRLAQDGAQVLVAPGNGGTRDNRPLAVTDLSALAELADRERVDLTVVGPEAPLADGIVDVFQARGMAIFGPTRAAARLEWSKAWTKDFLGQHDLPTAAFDVVATEAEARRALARRGLPVVLKADGLAAGKGVFVCHSQQEADQAMGALFGGQVPGADQVVVEDLLQGVECSVLAFSDGERVSLMPPARDYKRLADGDRGPNTGGMGGYTWPSYATPDLLADVERQILLPTLAGMAALGAPYRGVLYAGLMLTADGPMLLEYNCRFGDPECELILPLLGGNLPEVLSQVADGALRAEDLLWRRERTYGVVLAAAGYPEAPRRGDRIGGLETIGQDVQAFHAGTAVQDGALVTSGGRVLTLVGTSRQAVYAGADPVHFEGKQFRRDIGEVELVPSA